jgi:hypothetical protein
MWQKNFLNIIFIDIWPKKIPFFLNNFFYFFCIFHILTKIRTQKNTLQVLWMMATLATNKKKIFHHSSEFVTDFLLRIFWQNGKNIPPNKSFPLLPSELPHLQVPVSLLRYVGTAVTSQVQHSGAK